MPTYLIADNDSLDFMNEIIGEDEIIIPTPPTRVIKKCPGPCVKLPKYKLVKIEGKIVAIKE